MIGGEGLTAERLGHVLVVTIDRPAERNALSPAASTVCAAIWDEFASDPGLRVAIVTGAGEKAFCAGSDLSPGTQAVPRPASGFGGLTQRDLAKPVIAAVNGIALGGGFELALACDLILAAPGASFGLTEPRLGLAPLAGGPHRLVRAIGEKRAMGLLLTARRVDAAEGLALGFVHEVVAAGTVLDRALALAGEMAALSPAALRACKQLAVRTMGEASVEAAMAAQGAYPAVAEMLASDDRKEGVRAFREKRTPRWSS